MWNDNEYFELENQTTWLADLIFQRYNRTIKYIDNGNLLIHAEMADWSDVWARAIENYDTIIIFCASILLNLALFFFSFLEGFQVGHKKHQYLISNFAFCNFVLSIGFLIYTFFVDIYYDVDSFNTLIKLNANFSSPSIWSIAKQIIHVEMVENFAIAQSLILFTLSLDRYLSLLDDYTQHVKRPFLFAILNIFIPYVLALIVFDYYVIRFQFDEWSANVIRLIILAASPLFSAVFMGCNLARIVHKQKLRQINNADECLTSVALTLIVLTEIVQKFGLFLELLKMNFMFEIVIGEEESDATLKNILNFYFVISHTLFLLNPLYSSLILIFLTSSRHRFLRLIKSLFQKLWCNKKTKLDYNSETMRSIIAEQARARQLQMLTSYER